MASESMRNKIVKAVETLVKDTPVSKLTVGQISAAAGVSRQTFYYHFENIPAIYKWALKSKINNRKRSAGAILSFVQALDQWFRALEKNKILTLAFLTSSYALELFDFIRGEL